MISLNKNVYQSSDQWLDAFCADDTWQGHKQRLEEDYSRNGTSNFKSFRDKANESIGKGCTYEYWYYTNHNLYSTIRQVWEESDLSIPKLGVQVMGMLTIIWLDEKLEKGYSPIKKTDEPSSSIFRADIDTEKLKDGIIKMWNSSAGFERGQVIQGELLTRQNEWMCFYKIFEELEWLENSDRSAFVTQMQKWFGTKKKDCMYPCTGESLKAMDGYIKTTPAREWDAGDRAYHGTIRKMRELIFICSVLRKEFSDEKYAIKTRWQ